MEQYAGSKSTRVVRVFRTDVEWQDGTQPAEPAPITMKSNSVLRGWGDVRIGCAQYSFY